MKIFSLYGLTDELKERLKKIAKEKEWSLSKTIIHIIIKYLGGK